MKKLSFILIIFTLVFVLASCGGGANSDTGANSKSDTISSNSGDSKGEGVVSGTSSEPGAPSSSSGQSATEENTSSSPSGTNVSSGGGTFEKTEPILIGKDAVDARPIPVSVYNEDVGMAAYIYVERDEFIRYLDSGQHGDVFPLRELEAIMALPFYFFRAEEFDDNGLAIVTLEQSDSGIFRSFIIDTEGVPVTESEKNYEHIERIEDCYLCYFSKFKDAPQSVDILDEHAALIQTIEETGYGFQDTELSHIISFPAQDKRFDLHKMEFISHVPEHPQRAMYSTMKPIGGGYYAVSDFSEEGDIPQETLQRLPEGTYKKAIYKDGTVLSGYDFFIINHVKDGVFFVFDGTEYYFYDVLRGGKIFASLVNQCIGNYQFRYMPGLLIGYNLEEYVYITEKSIVKNHPVFHFDEEIYFYNLNYNEIPSYTLFSQVLLKNEKVGKSINKNILAEAGGLYPRIFEHTSESIIPYSSADIILIEDKIGDMLKVIHRSYNYSHGNHFRSNRNYFYYYDLKTGKRLTLDDWFTNRNQAIAILIANADRKYRELYPNDKIPEDSDRFFQVDLWEQYIDFDTYGFYIIIPLPDKEVDFEFTASKEDLKLFLNPEIYELIK